MLTAGLRYETGGDWTSYTSIFESIEPIDEVLTGQATAIDTLPIEIGYKYLNSIVRFFTTMFNCYSLSLQHVFQS